ncbi:MAG: hypothetical protein QJR05_13715 [Thermoanaerobacterium sp.]|nr:hypothetical protein [Thermoanaerobacterium sp.]
MKVSKKDIIIFILLAIIITTAIMAGHYKIQRDRMEVFVNQSCYMKFVDYFLRQNENLYDQFKPIFEEKHITVKELVPINQSAKEIVTFVDELTDYYNAFYGNSNNILGEPSQYTQLMHSVIYVETFKLLNGGKYEIEIPDYLIEYFNRIQLEEKLSLIQKAIQEFRNQHATYLENPLMNPAGKSFLKDAYWQKLFDELDDRLLHAYRYINP